MGRWRMDAEGGRVVHRERRTRKLAVVVAVQNVLVTACLAVTLYLCLDVQRRTPRAEQESKENVHIRLDAVSDITKNGTLEFRKVSSNKSMSLDGDQIYVACSGPYVLYMYVCYTDMGGDRASGELQLLVAGRRAPVCNFNLTASHMVCEGLQSTVYLKDKEKLSMYLNVKPNSGFKVKNVTLGLSYMLGSQCLY